MLLPSPLLPPALPLGHLPWLGGYFIIPDSRNIPSLLREQSPCKKGVQELSATGGEAGAALPACPRVVCVLQTHRTHFSLTPGWLQPLDQYNPQYFGSELPAPHSSPGAAHPTRVPVLPGLSRWEDPSPAGPKPAGRQGEQPQPCVKPARSQRALRKSPPALAQAAQTRRGRQGNPAPSCAGASGCAGDINPK